MDATMISAVEAAVQSAPPATGRVIDMTHMDYSFEPERKGISGRVATYSAYTKADRPSEGDQLLLRNGARSSRYRVVDVNHCWDVDPATMWIAHVVFDPRV